MVSRELSSAAQLSSAFSEELPAQLSSAQQVFFPAQLAQLREKSWPAQLSSAQLFFSKFATLSLDSGHLLAIEIHVFGFMYLLMIYFQLYSKSHHLVTAFVTCCKKNKML